MSKYFFLCLIALSFLTSMAQTKHDSLDIKRWKITGTNSLTGNQSSFNNWQIGGTSNLTINARINYDFNYQKKGWNWDNKLIAAYGFNRQKKNSTKKTDDRIEINSILAKPIRQDWYFSAYLNFQTQFDKGYDPKDEFKTLSRFASPIFLQFGPGFLWKKHDDFKINFSPAATKFIFVHEKFTKDGKSFSVEQNETERIEFGASIYVYYRFKILENITIENILGTYANYIENTKNVDFDYQLNIDLKVTKYITTNINYQALYDNETFGALQQKQSVGVGVKYTIN
nr:DUF3078 domain-containing protein [uncultured Flavobacterium sp.]